MTTIDQDAETVRRELLPPPHSDSYAALDRILAENKSLKDMATFLQVGEDDLANWQRQEVRIAELEEGLRRAEEMLERLRVWAATLDPSDEVSPEEIGATLKALPAPSWGTSD